MLCVYWSRKPQEAEGRVLLKGKAQPTRARTRGNQGWLWYLAHLAEELLVVREVVWDLGGIQEAHVESRGGPTSPP